jgi:hypothetical protein
VFTDPEAANTAANAKPAIEVSTDFSRCASTCEPYREFIETSLAKGRNAMAIWQDLVDQYGFANHYASVRRFVVKLRGESAPQACAIIRTAPGEEAQVDYGSGPMVRDPDTASAAARAYRTHARLQPQIDPASYVSVECDDLGAAARASLCTAGR